MPAIRFLLFHFWEVAVGIGGPSAIVRDFPAVTLPAILGTLLTLWAIANARAERRPPKTLMVTICGRGEGLSRDRERALC